MDISICLRHFPVPRHNLRTTKMMITTELFFNRTALLNWLQSFWTRNYVLEIRVHLRKNWRALLIKFWFCSYSYRVKMCLKHSTQRILRQGFFLGRMHLLMLKSR
uniref:Uncharacterized protein n=1 Tax=Helianthus annuus TaxID=4232 RepID=A0A251VQZ9_HELAN